MTTGTDETLAAEVNKIALVDRHDVYQDAFPTRNPTDALRIAVADELSAVSGVDKKLIYPGLAWTNTLDKGDLLLAVPRLRVKGASPADLASKWASEFPAQPLIKPPESDGINIRFFANPQVFIPLVLKQVLTLREQYGLNPKEGLRDSGDPSKGKKRVIVEFSSPNIAKEFHVGHLRSTIIGGFLSHLLAGEGYEVVRMNYLGDWGRQYGLLAIGWRRYGNEDAFQQDPIKHLFDIYVKISADFKPEDDAYKAAKKRGEDTSVLESQGLLGEAKAYFKSMEDGDKDAINLWRRFRDLSIEKYKQSYARLNVSFTDYSGESQVRQESMELAESILKEKGVCEIDEGATIIDFRKHGAPKLEVAIIRNRNGTSNYLLRDIGAAIQRLDTYNPDKMIYVVMSEQAVHLLRLFKILDLMGGRYAELSKKMQHITYGKVMGMSTRKGTVKFLTDILNDVGESMHEVMRNNEAKYSQVEEPEKVADILGISSIVVQDFSGKRINNYPFDLARMTSFEGDTGPYLQYAHARLCSILRKVTLTNEELLQADFSLLHESHAIDLVRLMSQYPDMVIQTVKTLEPTTILTYLFRLTHQLSSSYDVLRVVGAAEGHNVTVARAALYEAARQVIHNGMSLLGLNPVDR
ncbi:MAG: hypothetical protein M1820_009919 [Bogoriella megaspora]|nr:MAG: hypothetical protein M1820_009919 [Bogoriella megaspora]